MQKLETWIKGRRENEEKREKNRSPVLVLAFFPADNHQFSCIGSADVLRGITQTWESIFICTGSSTPKKGLSFSMWISIMHSLLFQAFLEMALGTFGGLNPTHYNPFPLLDLIPSLHCVEVFYHRKVLPYLHLAPLLQPNLPSHSVLIPIVPGYYQQFLSVISNSTCLSP